MLMTASKQDAYARNFRPLDNAVDEISVTIQTKPD